VKSGKRKTSAALHGNVSEKVKTSATLHGNACRPDCPPNMCPPKTPQTMYFKLFLKLFRAPPEHLSCAHQKIDQPKWTPKSAQGDRTKHSFSNSFVAFCVLLHRLGDRPWRALHVEKEQYRIGFIHVFDTLIESMLDRRTVTPKSKNERHAAWERYGAKRNERHAAWERFSHLYGTVGCLQEGPPKMC
jgi:hypothetical protein